LQRELEIAPILLCQRRQRQHHVGYVDALSFRQCAAHDDFGFREVMPGLLHLKAKLAVVEQKIRDWLQCGEYFRMRQIRARDIAWFVGEVEPKRRAHVQHDGPCRERAYPELRSLHVGQYPDWASQFLLHLANLRESLAVLLMGTVTEVEAKHIDARH